MWRDERRWFGVGLLAGLFVLILALRVAAPTPADDMVAPMGPGPLVLRFGAGQPPAPAKKKLPIYSVQTEKKRIAISFDATWGADKTPRLLEILRRHNVKTTFFLVSMWIRKYPEQTRMIAREGHEIGLHSATHPDFRSLSDAEIRRELEDNLQAVRETTGFEARLFRPPFGAYDDRVITVVERMGIIPIQWDVDSLDWMNVTPQQIVDRVTRLVRPGSIVLFHNNAESTPAALPEILRRLQGEGYEIVPVSQLLHKGPYYIDHTGRQIPTGPPRLAPSPEQPGPS
ncbi:polysaccharide deacetylase [Thermaerobacter marianensis DSM 12885]|uniref:Polysaccharide deacetylase n=1 Tax=Thermaerobacter marianensis (strain ATCC 700841 / DSM 12885 / JCM 10246 / 7p75a) TaxID=644966 RepID=E6SMN5_THEM7|nr:polysaccharide deacetylase family protein [Thermaerobacter marianensis]ADU51527.1 polysaccharide deacetylase [Thermaerobacter marianensis DSM 12885]